MPKSNLLSLTAEEPAAFLIESDGDGQWRLFARQGYASGSKEQIDEDAEDKETEEKPRGAVYATDEGSCFLLLVKGADDGSGSAEVEIVMTGQPGDSEISG